MKHLQTSKSDLIFTIAIVAIFAVVSLIGTLHHEMWRDELAHWLLVTDRPNLFKMLNDVRYLAHPALWHFCLYWISLFTAKPIAMQIFHWVIAVGAVYIFTRYAPFSKLQKALFAFGYFPLYEYGVISRNYSPGVVLLFLFCALYERRKKRYWELAIILFLLANVNLFTLIITMSLSAMMVLEWWFDQEFYKTLATRRKDLLISTAIILAGIGISVFTLKQPPDGTLSPNFDYLKLFQYGWIKQTIFTSIWQTYCPIPDFTLHSFWNSNALLDTKLIFGSTQLDSDLCAGIISLFLVLFVVFLLIRKPAVIFFYLSASAGITLFIYVFFLGVYRHLGFIYFVLLASLWLAEYFPERELSPKLIDLNKTFIKYRNIFLILILSIHFGAGVYALAMDYKYQFTPNQQVVAYIKSQKLDRYMIIGTPDAVGLPIAAYLEKDIFYLEFNRFGRSIIADGHRHFLDPAESFAKVLQMAQTEKQDMLVISGNEVSMSDDNGQATPLTTAKIGPDTTITKLKSFTDSIVEDERYYLYLIVHEKK